jgi:hypothetical protein
MFAFVLGLLPPAFEILAGIACGALLFVMGRVLFQALDLFSDGPDD